jgi:hypothetical protein
MKKQIIFFSLSIVVISFWAFASNHRVSMPNSPQHCKNEEALFSIPDTLKSIRIDYNRDPDSIMNFVENQLQIDLCEDVAHFGLILNDLPAVRVALPRMCDDGTIRCGLIFPEFRIILNQLGESMVNENRILIGSIGQRIANRFPDTIKYNLQEISLLWTPETPKDSIEKTMKQIVDGYLMNYEFLARQLFATNVCELNKAQLNRLKKCCHFG